MLKKITLIVFLSLFNLVSANAAEDVSFKGESKASSGGHLILTGKMFKPQGNGSFPAVVLMHGCGGIQPFHASWAEKITTWGYVTLLLDSFNPRGIKDVCHDPNLIPENSRAQDAFDAKSYLSGLPFVDRNRIGLMGWSHGGNATLCTVSPGNMDKYWSYKQGLRLKDLQKKGGSFKVAIAFYPFCGAFLNDSESPLLILTGEKDDWNPPIQCETYVPPTGNKNELIVKVYPGAFHGFDLEGVDRTTEGHRILYDPQAAADAVTRVKAFLKKYLQE